MRGTRAGLYIILITFICGAILPPGRGRAGLPQLLELREDWKLQSSAKVKEEGAAISLPGYDDAGWEKTTVPTTVLAALIKAGRYPDPYFGKNLLRIPGSLRPPLDVSAFSMPLWSPFRRAWWFRTEFEVEREAPEQRVWLHFNGICYRANVWVNGTKIADAAEMAGVFRYFGYDITAQVRPGEKNSLAVEVFPPRKHDLAFTWVDWNPAPPDRGMGLWREVYLRLSGPVMLSFPAVISELEPPALDHARLMVVVEAANALSRPVAAKVRASLLGVVVEKTVELGAGDNREVVFSWEEFPELEVKNPRLWWPYQLGEPSLHEAVVTVEVEGKVSDEVSTRFGIREITAEMTPEGNLVFLVNGRRVLIRGAGWTSDMMFRWDFERLEAELRYVREMNLNALRLEGMLESDRFYERCDELGILVLAGWCCCHHWERWYKWDREDYHVAEESERTQIKRLRSHPSVLAWLNGSDFHPPPRVEQMYLDVIRACRWPNPVISSATEAASRVSGPSGVKMTGPYEYIPPVYWYEDTKRGGAWGFNTETSPGPAVPPVESLKAMLPDDHWWPIDDYWDYHAGRGQFGNIEIYRRALEARYGRAAGVEDFALKSQAMAYELQRAMMEAYGRNKYVSTGVIQWMLNDAWPKIIWHLYDYYLRPGGGYFGTKKALEPLHIQFSYDDRSVVIVNSTWESFSGLRVRAVVYDLEMRERWAKEAVVNAGPDEVGRLFPVPEPERISPTYFLHLTLRRPEGEVVSTNFYWLSTRPDTLNWVGSTWFYTPARTHADYTGLNNLPPVPLEAEMKSESRGEMGVAVVQVRNPSTALAFLVRLKITRGRGGEEILPVFWEDNYFALLPAEERTVKAEYRLKDLHGEEPALEVSGWNVVPPAR